MKHVSRSRRGSTAVSAALAAFLAGGCGVEGDTTREPRKTAGLAGAALTAVDPHYLHMTTGGAQCTDCHVGGALNSFGPIAYAPGQPAPSFDSVAKTCSNVACHMVPAGVYTIATYDWGLDDGTMDYYPVNYGGVPVTTPPWYSATTGGCIACHSDPPSPFVGAWHSGVHGNMVGGSLNECSLCHPDVIRVNGVLALNSATNCGPSRTESCAALHRNGTVNVTPMFTSSCFGCH
jgi:predicted CxxxxCH...CXXCH cytochrome family protein